jgi:hexokinase
LPGRLAEQVDLFGSAVPGLLARHNRLDTAHLAAVDEDDSPELSGVAAVLEEVLGVRGTSRQQRQTVRRWHGWLADWLAGCCGLAGRCCGLVECSFALRCCLLPPAFALVVHKVPVHCVARQALHRPCPRLATKVQVQEVCQLVCLRSARLCAAAIAGVLKRIGHPGGNGTAGQDVPVPRVVVAVDGSVFAKYPKYR